MNSVPMNGINDIANAGAQIRYAVSTYAISDQNRGQGATLKELRCMTYHR